MLWVLFFLPEIASYMKQFVMSPVFEMKPSKA